MLLFKRSMFNTLLNYKRYKLIFLILLLSLGLVIQSRYTSAEEELILVPEENVSINNDDYSSYDDTDTEYIYSDLKENKYSKSKKQKSLNKKLLSIGDSLFSADRTVTLKDLIFRTGYIVLILFGVLLLVKMYFSRYRFHEAGTLFDNVAQKLTNVFSNPNGIKLKHALILTPGQNLYIVEVEGRSFLLGGTHQGGIQFLADLTERPNSDSLSFKEIEGFQKQKILKEQNVQFQDMTKAIGENVKHIDLAKTVENPFMASSQTSFNESGNGQFNGAKTNSFKRKPNFRQGLLKT